MQEIGQKMKYLPWDVYFIILTYDMIIRIKKAIMYTFHLHLKTNIQWLPKVFGLYLLHIKIFEFLFYLYKIWSEESQVSYKFIYIILLITLLSFLFNYLINMIFHTV